MLNRSEFLKWQRELGVTFSVDACCDPDGFNSQVSNHFYSKNKSFLQADVSGQTVWCNPPFDSAATFLSHYLQCKVSSPWSTSGVFILPKWKNPQWATLTKGMRLLHEYPAHTQLFTRPNADPALDRVQVGPAPWPVQVYYDPPLPSSTTNIFLDNQPSTSGSSPPSQYPPELSSLTVSLSLKPTPPLSSLPKPTKSPILSPKLSAHHHHTLPQIPPLPLFPQLFPPTPLSPSSPNLYTPKQTSSVHFPSSQILTWLNSS